MGIKNDERQICHFCVHETFLSERIYKENDAAPCSYCESRDEPAISLDQLADEIEGAFERHFVRTAADPDAFESAMLRDKEIDYEWDREGEPVLFAIAAAAEVSEKIAQDLLDALEERHAVADSDYVGEEDEFSSDSYYEEKGVDDFEFRMEFDAVERSVKQRIRYFNREAENFFQRLFANLNSYADRQGAPVIVPAGPDHDLKSFFRARAFHGEDELVRALKRPDLELGAPPAPAAKAGRMNAQGVSVFYGANLADAALAEIRPPVGSRILIGRFDLARNVRLLDIAALQSVFIAGSYFDPDYLSRLELAAFLARLSERMTMPVMPNDEPTEYLITQMIADFVAQLDDPPIDGMLYPSVQAEGEPKNVVLFNPAARVAEWEFPEGTTIDADTFEMDEDGGSVNYSVVERTPPPKPQEDTLPEIGRPFVDWDLDQSDFRVATFDPRDPTLKLDPEALQVHHVTGVVIATDSYDVSRYRLENWPEKLTSGARMTEDNAPY